MSEERKSERRDLIGDESYAWLRTNEPRRIGDRRDKEGTRADRKWCSWCKVNTHNDGDCWSTRPKTVSAEEAGKIIVASNWSQPETPSRILCKTQEAPQSITGEQPIASGFTRADYLPMLRAVAAAAFEAGVEAGYAMKLDSARITAREVNITPPFKTGVASGQPGSAGHGDKQSQVANPADSRPQRLARAERELDLARGECNLAIFAQGKAESERDEAIRLRDLAVRELDEHAKELDAARALVDRQANDEALWFQAQTAPEGYLQRALRELHAAIEAAPENLA